MKTIKDLKDEARRAEDGKSFTDRLVVKVDWFENEARFIQALGKSIRDAVVSDESGHIKMTLWDELATQVKEGDLLTITNPVVTTDSTGGFTLGTKKDGSVTYVPAAGGPEKVVAAMHEEELVAKKVVDELFEKERAKKVVEPKPVQGATPEKVDLESYGGKSAEIMKMLEKLPRGPQPSPELEPVPKPEPPVAPAEPEQPEQQPPLAEKETHETPEVPRIAYFFEVTLGDEKKFITLTPAELGNYERDYVRVVRERVARIKEAGLTADLAEKYVPHFDVWLKKRVILDRFADKIERHKIG
jgi:hypothetical protein